MGMYDNLRISVEKLPISKDEKKLIGKDHIFQTKDFENILTMVEITEDSRIKIKYCSFKSEVDESFPLGFKLVEKNVRHEYLSITKYINFYTMIEEKWFEFQAHFVDGKMISIKGGLEMEY